MLNATQIKTLVDLVDEQIDKIQSGELSGFDGGGQAEIDHLSEIKDELEKIDVHYVDYGV